MQSPPRQGEGTGSWPGQFNPCGAMAEQDFAHLNEYAAVVRIAASLQDKPPTYVLDQRGLMPSLRYLLPGIFGSYEAVSNSPGLYQRRK